MNCSGFIILTKCFRISRGMFPSTKINRNKNIFFIISLLFKLLFFHLNQYHFVSISKTKVYNVIFPTKLFLIFFILVAALELYNKTLIISYLIEYMWK